MREEKKSTGEMYTYIKMMTKEKYFSEYRILKTSKKALEHQIFEVEFINHGISYPERAFLKFLKDNSEEAEIHQYLSKSCEYICKFYCATDEEHDRIMFFQYFSSGNLKSAFDKNTEFKEVVKIRWTKNLCYALNSIHAQNYFHGAISSEVIFIDNSLYLGGFSDSAHYSPENLKKYQDSRKADENYPEELKQDPFKADAFNLGLVLLRLWCPKHTFNSNTEIMYIIKNAPELIKSIKIRQSEVPIKNILSSLLRMQPNLKFACQNLRILEYTIEDENNKCNYCKKIFNAHQKAHDIGCIHKYHSECLSEHISEVVKDASNISQLKCKFCDQNFSYELEIYSLPKIKLEIRYKCELLNLANVNFTCPFDHESTEKIVNKNLKINKINCHICNTSYCGFCKMNCSFLNCQAKQVIKDSLKFKFENFATKRNSSCHK